MLKQQVAPAFTMDISINQSNSDILLAIYTQLLINEMMSQTIFCQVHDFMHIIFNMED